LAHHDIHAVVNCAGVNHLMKFEQLSMDMAQHIMDVNMWGQVNTTWACLESLAKHRGQVCNIISTAAHQPMTYSLAYNVSKAAAHMATRQMARELGPKHGVTVFGVSPSLINSTPMTAQVDDEVMDLRDWSTEQLEEHRANPPMWPEDVADFLVDVMEEFPDRCLAGLILPYGGEVR